MCGLVAIISKTQSGFFQQDKTIFYQMLISDVFRGIDSTGCFAVNKHGNLKWVKDASASPFFLNKKETVSFMDKFIPDYHIMVGHNRKATMGTVVSENAHPFTEGNICLVHNGTLKEHTKLAKTTVDSHAICHHINEHGYKSMFRNIDGAYALIWYNAEEKTLYFARNAERPLYIVETETKIYLASEDKMLDWILDRNNISKYKIQIVPTDKIFKFSLETRKLECETKPKKEEASNHKAQNWMQQSQSHKSGWKKRNQPSLKLLSNNSSQGSHQTTEASIETYRSGEQVAVKVVDFDTTEINTKLILETLDGYGAICVKYLSNALFTPNQIDGFINAERLTGTIQNITSKKGNITVYLRELSYPEKWRARGGVIVDPIDIENAGGACWQCGTSLASEKDVEFAEITTASNGDITYMLCEHCADSMSGNHYGVC